MDKEVIRDRMSGCLYGHATGDALGLGSEFMSNEGVSGNYLFSNLLEVSY